MSKFKKDLIFGNKYEEEFIKVYNPYRYEIKRGYYKEFDIEIWDEENESTRYEVKADRWTNKTGNICIEFECNNKPSGITTTWADYYVYFVIKNDSYDLYIIPVYIINELIKDKKYKSIKKGGDNYGASFYLFDKTIFNDYLKKIN
jgi:hypothetical protein